MAKRQKRTFTDEFKGQMVKLYESGKPIPANKDSTKEQVTFHKLYWFKNGQVYYN